MGASMIGNALAEARVELSKKSREQIDLETAVKWGARAVAAFEVYRRSGDVRWFGVAVEYAHEAREHAANGPPGTLERIRQEMKVLTGEYGV